MSWADLAADLATTAIEVLGNDVEIAGVTGHGILREPAEMVIDGQIVVNDYMLELPVSQWSIVVEGTPIVVDGRTFTARESSRPTSDGSSIVVPLGRPSGPVTVIYDGDWDA